MSGGYRVNLYFPKGQNVPDARMSAHLVLGEFRTEFLNGSWHSSTTRDAKVVRNRIREQLARHVPVARQFGGLTVARLCENYALREVAREEAANISMVEQVRLSALPLLRWHVTVAHLQPGLSEVASRLLLFLNFYVECEQYATTRREIRGKLMPLLVAVRAGHDVACFFICQTRRACEFFREVHQILQRQMPIYLPLITSTDAEVSAGRFNLCWSMDGKTV